MAVTVPTVSKKSERRSVKTRRMQAMSGIRSKEPKRLKSPNKEKSGLPTTSLGTTGTLSPQPFGLTSPVAPLNPGPI